VGDRVLVDVVATVNTILRGGCVIGRLGGEEFAVLLPNTSVLEATIVANRICAAVRELSFDGDAETLRITTSIGLASTTTNDQQVDAVIARADKGLYQAKRDGRNCYRMAQTSDPSEAHQSAP
jgi:diguanylate cyclase (GGDEF)-like protein